MKIKDYFLLNFFFIEFSMGRLRKIENWVECKKLEDFDSLVVDDSIVGNIVDWVLKVFYF